MYPVASGNRRVAQPEAGRGRFETAAAIFLPRRFGADRDAGIQSRAVDPRSRVDPFEGRNLVRGETAIAVHCNRQIAGGAEVHPARIVDHAILRAVDGIVAIENELTEPCDRRRHPAGVSRIAIWLFQP